MLKDVAQLPVAPPWGTGLCIKTLDKSVSK